MSFIQKRRTRSHQLFIPSGPYWSSGILTPVMNRVAWLSASSVQSLTRTRMVQTLSINSNGSRYSWIKMDFVQNGCTLLKDLIEFTVCIDLHRRPLVFNAGPFVFVDVHWCTTLARHLGTTTSRRRRRTRCHDREGTVGTGRTLKLRLQVVRLVFAAHKNTDRVDSSFCVDDKLQLKQ